MYKEGMIVILVKLMESNVFELMREYASFTFLALSCVV